jgi:hypothetical protein
VTGRVLPRRTRQTVSGSTADPAHPNGIFAGTGLLRLLPAAEAPAARLQHRTDFVHRYTALMGYPPAESDCDRWWPR